MSTTSSTFAGAAADSDGLALIGRTLADLRGIRFDNGEGGSTPPAAPPAEPAAPATPPAPAAPSPATVAQQAQQRQQQAPPAAPKPPKPADVEGVDFDQLDPRTQAYVRELRQEASDANKAKAAAESSAAEAIKQAGIALGLIKEEPPAGATPDPAATARTAELERENAAVRVALTVPNLDVPALLDSRTFLTSLSAVEPSDPVAIKAAIDAATTANPSLIKTALPGRSGDRPGGSAKQQPSGLAGVIASAMTPQA